MCGIAGIFGLIDPTHDGKTLASMLRKIKHRGPDGQGERFFAQAALGHVRLAVIDIAGGGQPMSTLDGRYHISYNGEVYNFRELRRRLEEGGAVFETASDTEVILAAYHQYGIEAFSRFRGMFSLAIWDEQKREGLLVRDRFGIKPLFYTVSADRLLFASEIKGLLPALNGRPEMDLNSVHLLMNFRYIPGNQTMFENVFHLPPGHFLQWRDGGYHINQWAGEENVESAPDIEKTRAFLEQAVQRQLVSDVPLGGYLSAGLDSATILALTTNDHGNGKSAYPTFTIQTGDSPLEFKQAADTARFFGVENHQEPIAFDIAAMLPWLVYHLEVPKVNALQSALVAKLARKHVTVALSGLGGDEIFLGYNIHQYLARLANLNRPGLKELVNTGGFLAEKLFGGMGIQYEELHRGGQVLRALPDFTAAYGILRNVWDQPAMRQRIYGPRMLQSEPENAFALLTRNWPADDDPVNAAAAYEIRQKMVNDLLLQEDRLSMACGLEVRVPFLDEDLVSLVAGMDRHDRIPNGKLKYLMRQAVGKWLPREILARPKSGFQVPIHQFFNTHLRPLYSQYLSRQRLVQDGLFNPRFVEEVLAARPHPRLRWHYFLLYLMMGVSAWIDIFEKRLEVSHNP